MSALSDTKPDLDSKEALEAEVRISTTYEHGTGRQPFNEAQTKALLKKLDWHMIPYLSLL